MTADNTKKKRGKGPWLYKEILVNTKDKPKDRICCWSILQGFASVSMYPMPQHTSSANIPLLSGHIKTVPFPQPLFKKRKQWGWRKIRKKNLIFLVYFTAMWLFRCTVLKRSHKNLYSKRGWQRQNLSKWSSTHV